MAVDVFDDVYPYETFRVISDACCHSPFLIGWQEGAKYQTDVSDAQLGCLHSKWIWNKEAHCDWPEFHPKEDLVGKTENSKIKEFVNNREPTTAVVNLVDSSGTYTCHVHPGFDVMLVYANVEWRRDWCGETLFYDDKAVDLVKAIEPRPNRVALFSGDTPHSIRPSSTISPKFRFSVTMMFEK